MRALLFVACAVAFGQPADLVLRNGKIVTMNAAQPAAEAMAVRGDRIAALGGNADAAKWIGPGTKVIDLHGMLAIPGFIEGHGHFTGMGEFRLGLDLREARTWDEIVAQVARAAKQAKPGEWIVGRGWHQSKWDHAPEPNVEGFPLHGSLDEVSPNNPVLLTHASGHAAFVNAKAMEAAGITRDTPNPQGGEILKDKQGNPTGLLREQAEGLVNRAYGQWQAARTDLRKVINLAADECLAKGITTFEDAGSPLPTVDVFRSMAENHELRLRMWVMLRTSNQQLEPNLDRYRTIGAGGNYLTVRAIKAADGWRARVARRVAAGAVRRPAGQPRVEHGRPGRYPQDRGAGHPARVSALHSRHRRPGQPRGAGHLRAGVSRASRAEGPALARGARAAPERGRHSALREAGRGGGHAGDSLHLRRPLRDSAAGAEARRRGGLRVAEAHAIGRGGGERNGRAGGRRQPAGVVLRIGEPQAEGRFGVLSRASA